MQAKHYLLTVVKNTLNQIKVDVPDYEIPILQDIHGMENVLNSDGKLVKSGLGEPTRTRDINEEEYERLCHKYGKKRIEKCIGSIDAFLKIFEEKPAKRRTKKDEETVQEQTQE